MKLTNEQRNNKKNATLDICPVRGILLRHCKLLLSIGQQHTMRDPQTEH